MKFMKGIVAVLSVLIIGMWTISSCGGGGGNDAGTNEVNFSADLSGTVVDSLGKPMPGTTVTFAGFSTTTDENGYFLLTEVDKSNGTLEFTLETTFYSQNLTLVDGSQEDLGQVEPQETFFFDTATWYKDNDGDGYSSGDELISHTRPIGYLLPEELTSEEIDCNDSNIAINPGANDLCENAIDEDCDGNDLACPILDDFVEVTGKVLDTDGMPASNATITIAEFTVNSDLSGQFDINIESGTYLLTIKKYGIEFISSEVTIADQDQFDLGTFAPEMEFYDTAKNWFLDYDRDYYSNGNTLTEHYHPNNYFLAIDLFAITGDCNDSNPDINPGAEEICGNLIDDDCVNGDEECVQNIWFKDFDGDGYTDGIYTIQDEQPEGFVAPEDLFGLDISDKDCNDYNYLINPGVATDICGDLIDQNCDGIDPICIDNELKIYSFDGTFLGNANYNRFDVDSICNGLGPYGSKYAVHSIWNKYGLYGSDYAIHSAFSDFTTHPPAVYQNNVFQFYITTSSFMMPRIDSYSLLYDLQAHGCNVSR